MGRSKKPKLTPEGYRDGLRQPGEGSIPLPPQASERRIARVVTRAEARRRYLTIRHLYLDGRQRDEIYPHARTIFGIGVSVVDKIIQRVEDELQSMVSPDKVELNRGKQAARIEQHIGLMKRGATKTDAQGNQVFDANKLNWAAVNGLERTLAAVLGTNRPIDIRVNAAVNDALVLAVGRLSPEELDEDVQEFETMRRKAEAFERQEKVVIDMPTEVPKLAIVKR